ncbi:MAG: PIN domain-containing protein [Candidatus Cloacimonetes bacterium]|nr:PIN domain-containing protein [Candidatus Cloacimonadota bacterium]
MEYLADTVAIVRHFSSTGKLGAKAKKIMQDADIGKNTVFVSIISIVEIMYLSEAGRIKLDLDVIKSKLDAADNYFVIDLNFDIIEVAKEIHGLELHDRLIVSTAKYLTCPILTSDRTITDLEIIQVIWK